jgi:ribosome recycling factor
MISDIEKAILKSDLGLNPANNGDTLRVPMPVLTEETRREYTKQAKNEAENARVALRNIRRDANSHLKDLEKDKEISEDDQRRSEERIQKLTDTYVGNIESIYQVKETDLLSI